MYRALDDSGHRMLEGQFPVVLSLGAALPPKNNVTTTARQKFDDIYYTRSLLLLFCRKPRLLRRGAQTLKVPYVFGRSEFKKVRCIELLVAGVMSLCYYYHLLVLKKISMFAVSS